MSTRTSIPGSKGGTTDSISVADFNAGPGGLIGKVKVTSDQGSITSLAAVSGLSITLTPEASRDLRIVTSLEMFAGTATGQFQVVILKDGTQINRRDFGYNPLSSGLGLAGACEALDENPTNASHTYSVSVGQSGGDANTWTMHSAATVPAYLWIFDACTTF